ncbi:HPr family phosphocarrier protein [Butyrivibrio sp. MB2005]|uniref:HPr family phosphocarrier protein n=1 Tax=Butyrivibrio sp. MB2005 TaxID=1280678 RepID=UPI000419674D|nr:HPr family phosphocarrier protein [Butyrivibrio sp. MB2005]
MIKLNPCQIPEFVNAASKCEFDVDVSYNRVTIDAKSILGVFGLDFRSPLKVSYIGYNQDFEKFLTDHIA